MSAPETDAKDELARSFEAVTLKHRMKSADSIDRDSHWRSTSSSSSGTSDEVFSVVRDAPQPRDAAGRRELWRSSHAVETPVVPLVVNGSESAPSPRQAAADSQSEGLPRQSKPWTIVGIKQGADVKENANVKPKPAVAKKPVLAPKPKSLRVSDQVKEPPKARIPGHFPEELQKGARQMASSEFQAIEQLGGGKVDVSGGGSVRSRASKFEGAGAAAVYAKPDMSKKSRPVQDHSQASRTGGRPEATQEEAVPPIPPRLYLDDSPPPSATPASPDQDKGPPNFKPPPPPVMKKQLPREGAAMSNPPPVLPNFPSGVSGERTRNGRVEQPPAPPSPFQDRRAVHGDEGPPSFKPPPPSRRDGYEEVVPRTTPVNSTNLYSSVDIVNKVKAAPEKELLSKDSDYEEVVVRKPPVKPPPYKPNSERLNRGDVLSSAVRVATGDMGTDRASLDGLRRPDSSPDLPPSPHPYPDVEPHARKSSRSSSPKSAAAKPLPPPRVSSISRESSRSPSPSRLEPLSPTAGLNAMSNNNHLVNAAPGPGKLIESDLIPERDLDPSAFAPKPFNVNSTSGTKRFVLPPLNGLDPTVVAPPPPMDFDGRNVDPPERSRGGDFGYPIILPPPMDEEPQRQPRLKSVNGIDPVAPPTSLSDIPFVPPPPPMGPPPSPPSGDPADLDFDVIPSPRLDDNALAASDEEDVLPPPPLPPTGRYGVTQPPSGFREERLQPLVPPLRKHR